MKPYSVARMRKECQVIFRLILFQAVFLLTIAAVCGALWKVLDSAETKEPLIFAGIFLVLSFFLSGAYLALSDTKWMARHTLYGKTLAGLGDAPALMAEIDKEAEAMDYECAGFALMAHWMVLYQSAYQNRFGGGVQIQSRPIPLSHIAGISWSRDSDEDNAGFRVRIAAANGAEYLLFVWEIADVEALRQWGEAKTRQN